jgi:hypothetical protein
MILWHFNLIEAHLQRIVKSIIKFSIELFFFHVNRILSVKSSCICYYCTLSPIGTQHMFIAFFTIIFPDLMQNNAKKDCIG